MEKEIFKRCQVDINKLLDYGFIKENDYYIYTKVFMENSFKAIIKIDKDNEVFGKVMDMNTNEEYIKIHLNNVGSYTAKVQDEYKKILEDIKKHCFKKEYFLFNQTNRIANYIQDKYGDNPEFLWDKFPGYGVFRNKNNNKWYAVIMDIKGSILDEELGLTEIINVKLNSDRINSLLKKKGFYKAYHMNKKDWITIVLNDTLSDDEINILIDESWNLINEK